MKKINLLIIALLMTSLCIGCKREEKTVETKERILAVKEDDKILTASKVVLLHQALSGIPMDYESFIDAENPGFFNKFKPKDEFEREEMNLKAIDAMRPFIDQINKEMKGITEKEFILTNEVGELFLAAEFGKYDFDKQGYHFSVPSFSKGEHPVQGRRFTTIPYLDKGKIADIKLDLYYKLKDWDKYLWKRTGRKYSQFTEPREWIQSLITIQNLQKFQFFSMTEEKARVLLENNRSRLLKVKISWKPISAIKTTYEFFLVDNKGYELSDLVIGRITKMEIYGNDNILIEVITDTDIDEETKQMASYTKEKIQEKATLPLLRSAEEVYNTKSDNIFHRKDSQCIKGYRSLSTPSYIWAVERGQKPCKLCFPSQGH